MKEKIPLIFIGFLLLTKALNSANIISAGDYELTAGATATVEISITNDQAFTAFQFDAVIPDQFTLVNGTVELAGRENGHDFSWELLSGNVLRFIAWSISETAFSGTSGPVVRFSVTAGTKPGTYPLVLQNVLVASDGVNIVDEIVHGNLTLRAPEITLLPESIDFGEVPLLQQSQRSITIQNTGNSPLTVTRLEVTHPDYSLNDATGFVLAAGSSVSRTLTFYATEKGIKNGEVKVTSDCPANPVSSIALTTTAFAVNELRLGTATGRSGYFVTLPVSINNMEPFTGFQFEINLPEQIQFVPESAQLSGRKTDHQISADTAQNKLIVTAWSPTNASFADDDGEIATLDFYLEGYGGYYYLNFTNPIIANAQATNILSASYGNNIRISAPSISLSASSHDFGRVSVTGSSEYPVTISNNGDDTLKIQSIASTQSSFTVTDESYPIVISPYQTKNISVTFENPAEGTYSGRLIIRNNDVNNDPTYLDLQGETFEPNELQVVNASGVRGALNYLEINMENYTEISAFQFDLQLPEGFTVVSDSSTLTERSDDHSLAISNLSGNTVRFISYSGSLKTYSGNMGSVLKIGLMTEQDTPPGNYTMQLQNVVLSDAVSRNVVSAVSDGQFELINCSVFETDTAAICAGDTLSFGTQTLTAAGEYTEVFPSVNGCDSTVTLTLTVDDCVVPTNFQVPSTTLTSGDSDCFNATDTITVAGDDSQVIVESGASAEFIAGQSIRFLPGFHAQEGSYMLGHITTTGSYCVEEAPAIVADTNFSLKEAVIADAEMTERQEREMVVYPNPNNGEFTVEFRNFEDEIRVMLFNSIGQMVYNEKTNEKQIQVRVPNLKSGMYFIKAVNKDEQFSRKVIVN
jgi:hypothetical protein